MQASTASLAMLTLAACANGADAPPPYDEVAHTLGADIATAAGGDLAALADTAMVAHGGMPPDFVVDPYGLIRGTHDGVSYWYSIVCFDGAGRKQPACGETTASASAVGAWGGVLHTPSIEASVFHQGVWMLRGLDTAASWATGTTWAAYSVTFGPNTVDATSYHATIDKSGTLLFDLDQLTVVAGALQADIGVTRHTPGAGDDDFTFTGTAIFERADRVRIELDDRAYWLDPATGELGAATVLY